MARRSSTYYSYSQRASPIRTLDYSLLSNVNLRRFPFVSPLSVYEDRRGYHPSGVFRPALGTSRLAGRVKRSVVSDAFGKMVRDQLRFTLPEKVVICARRKMRREVLFAERRTKSGAGARFRARNYYSDVSCR